LIQGDFANDVVTINDVLKLAPTTAPSSPTAGMIYFDQNTSKLRCYDGSQWNDLW
jgi:hypothetical protein